ncbi:MAG: hypothetical protein ABI443_04035 [Chthoniobacterales bacterium]
MPNLNTMPLVVQTPANMSGEVVYIWNYYTCSALIIFFLAALYLLRNKKNQWDSIPFFASVALLLNPILRLILCSLPASLQNVLLNIEFTNGVLNALDAIGFLLLAAYVLLRAFTRDSISADITESKKEETPLLDKHPTPEAPKSAAPLESIPMDKGAPVKAPNDPTSERPFTIGDRKI